MLLIILLFYEIAFFLISFAASKKDILSPSVVMCVMFIISTSFAILNYKNWHINYDVKAFLLLSGGIFTFVLGENAVRLCVFKKRYSSSMYPCLGSVVKYINIPFILLIFSLLFNLAISYWYFSKIRSVVGRSGLNISAIMSIYRSLENMNKTNAGDNLVSGLVVQLIKLVKVSGYLAGYILISNILALKKSINSRKGKKEVLLLCIIIASLFPSLLSAGRADILKYLSALIVYYYILWHQVNGWDKNLSWMFVRYGLVALIGGIVIFYYSLRLLGRQTDLDLFDYTSVYLGSSIQLFNLYVINPVERTSWGEESLIGVHKLLAKVGLVEPSKHYNLEFRLLGPGSDTSNIYTFFRRPLHDFGIIGMFVFTFLIAMFFSYIYYGKIKSKSFSLKTECWILVYGYLFYWIVSSSMLQYSGAYISFGTVSILLIMIIIYQLLRIMINTIRIDRIKLHY